MAFSTSNQTMQLHGQLTPDNVVLVRRQGEVFIAEQAKKDSANVYLDIERLQATSTLSLSLLLCWLRCAQKYNICLRLNSMPAWLEHLATMHNMTSFFVNSSKKPSKTNE